MRVCFISGEFPPMQGGVGDYTLELAKALSTLGSEPHVISVKSARDCGDMDVSPCIVHPIVNSWDWRSWRPIMRRLAQIKPDVVHIQYQAAAYGMRLAVNLLPLRAKLGRDLDLRAAVTFHDLRVPYLFPKAGPLRWRSILLLARSCDAVVVTNVADEFRLSQFDVGSTRIPIGANIKPVLPSGFERSVWRSRHGIGPDEALLCHFGFVNRKKGIETLVHALDLLARTKAPELGPRLLMIGGKTGSSDPTNVAYLSHVEGLIQSLGLQERVIWTGYIPQEEVSAAFAAADCCALPYIEGASLQHGTLMAALAHGMPIVTTRSAKASSCPVPEELVDRENVLLVPPDNASLLADAILDLLQSSGLQHRLREGAKATSNLFDWEGIAQQHLEVYSGLA